VRYFIDDALIARSRDALYFMLGVLAEGVAISLTAGMLRDFLSARVQSRSLSGLRQSMFERLAAPLAGISPRMPGPRIFSSAFRTISRP